MKRIICRREYDTDTANLLKKFTEGEYGDPKGYEESLYETPEGKLFIYTNGGASSEHPMENIRSISHERAEVWLKEHE